MSERMRELAERQRRLEERCALQRAAVAYEVRSIEQRFATVDRVAGVARSTLFHAALVAGIAALLTMGRAKGLRLIARALLFGTAVRRLLVAVGRL
jgi:hypothetical protein